MDSDHPRVRVPLSTDGPECLARNLQEVSTMATQKTLGLVAVSWAISCQLVLQLGSIKGFKGLKLRGLHGA